jgi:hypothetical protein
MVRSSLQNLLERQVKEGMAVKWYVFPPKFFAVPAQYENNVAQKF